MTPTGLVLQLEQRFDITCTWSFTYPHGIYTPKLREGDLG